jgi:hypothetical protein
MTLITLIAAAVATRLLAVGSDSKHRYAQPLVAQPSSWRTF